MVVHLTETFPKDINNNCLGSLSNQNDNKFYYFAELPKVISPGDISPNNQPSKGVKSVLLGPPSDAMVINYHDNCQTKDDVPETMVNKNDPKIVNPLPELNVHVNEREPIIGHTVSVSTCSSCGKESRPVISDNNCNYSVQINELKDRDVNSSRSQTPIREYYRSSTVISKKSMNSSSSSSSKMKKSLKLKGCHICNQYKPSTLSLTSSRKRFSNDCPYSIVLGSFHPGINPYNSNHRSGNGVNQSNGSKEETRRALIMIFTITSILLFLMITYYGAIIYLRMRVSNQNYTD